MPTPILIAIIVFVAIFTQSFVGFGLALVSMPLLSALLGLQTAAPLIALVGITAVIILLLHYRAALNIRAVSRLIIASLPGIVLGVWLLRGLDERIVLPLLGVIVAGYALYALANPRLPRLEHPRWTDALGFVAGLLGGAYNTPAPPVIVYASCRRWPPAEFKSNLQGFFIVNNTIVVITHFAAGNVTPAVMQHYLFALPAIVLGALAGFALDGRVDPGRFHRVVLVGLVAIGLSLVL
ncbi:MAG: sulfite exporter TauE/SafE family protein [Anaerolineae bacterium]|nr:sulfite exporter TauE/SafE family protein [Anaerolineae bacterium]